MKEMITILMIMTSHDQMINTDEKTGLWLSEFTEPYYEFVDAGYEVTFATPKGGEPPVDPKSLTPEALTKTDERFRGDKTAMDKFKNTVVLENINVNDFDAVFYPGGHGPIWDLSQDAHSGKIIVDALSKDKRVAAVCHGPAALIKAAELNPDILKSKKITGFSTLEEKLAQRENNVPYDLETKLKELGADYQKADKPFVPYVQQDGMLITGQNPASAKHAAQKLIEVLSAKKVK